MVARHRTVDARRHVEAAGRHALGDKPLRHHAHVVRRGAGEEALNALLLLGVDDRAEVEVHVGGAGAERRELGVEARDHLVIDLARHQEARAGRAGLPGILHHGVGDHRDGDVEVGVGEQHVGRLAAQLQGAADMVPGRRGLDQGAHLRRAGEGDEVDVRMGGKGRARLLTESGHDVDGAVGKAHLGGQLRHAQGCQAGILRRLHHGRIAHRQRRTDGAAEHLGRIVPGDDVAGDTMGHPLGGHEIAGKEGNGLPMQLVGGAAIEFEVARGGRDIGAGLLHGLAGVARLKLGELLGMVGDGDRELGEQAAPLGGGEAAPGPLLHRMAGRRHGGIHVILPAGGDLGEDAPLGGGIDVEHAARDGRAPAIVDEHALGGHYGAHLVHAASPSFGRSLAISPRSMVMVRSAKLRSKCGFDSVMIKARLESVSRSRRSASA